MGVGQKGLVTVLFCYLLLSCTSDDVSGNNQKVVGEWHVVAIHNSSPTGPTLGPNPGEVISIIFTQNGSFTGTTSANNFGGDNTVSETILTIEEMITTEVADTLFGQAFYESFNESRNPDTGFSEFELSFQNGNTLNLEYQGFKFLSLQKQ